MLAEYITTNRDLIIARTRERVALRAMPQPTERELSNGIPMFLDQLGAALRIRSANGPLDHSEIAASATLHGHDLLGMGLTIAQVVHDYGDVCQVITQLAVQQDQPIPPDEFRTLNLCLDDAIAAAVTAYTTKREHELAGESTERLGVLAHELRNLLNVATLSFESIRGGRVAVGGSTGMLHARTLRGLGDLVDRSLADVRLDAGLANLELISVASLVEEIEIGALVSAMERDIHLAVSYVDPTVTVEGDRQTLFAAVSNLLHNAFKFTPKGGSVSLTTSVSGDRVLFDVEDECGGLPPGKLDNLFRPFEQRGADRSGLGLGLSIALKAAKANGGEIRVRDLPGKGCIFTLDLPRKAPPPLAVVVPPGSTTASTGGGTGSSSALGNDGRGFAG